ncbi:hypothetical protein E1A91_A13G144600v1 [Gossypium mustelinum]|uniref:Uncharacterized protein n=3 Tax=Gossypium TaxID=3633 RepID=A0A5J5T289_GOSBA|nr:hypothetical protein ES319_A13G139100v1 [Gossypium barbadense]TYG86621.1 hypothetical protein ES288_A13G148300v1 [Gossypium darwinii]TYJ01305.1 hypothetical protein E1A91_A13G144600v1 [Gossypium mustelinum]
MKEGGSTNPDNTQKMGQVGKRKGKKRASMRELKAEMAMICEEQNRLREGQKEVHQKFLKIQSKFSLLREQGNSALFFQ